MPESKDLYKSMRMVHLPEEKKRGFDKWYICKEENIDMKMIGV